MNPRLSLILFPLLAAPLSVVGEEVAAPALESPESVVRFRTNAPLFDQLSGTLDALTADALLWKSPELLERPATFRLDQVLDISLPAETPESDADHEATVTLKKGGIVRGQLASVSDEMIELDTWYAGRMKFNRVMVTDVAVDERSIVAYRGPSGPAGWVFDSDEPMWSCEGNTLVSKGSGSIGREMEILPVSRVAFDVEWRGGLQMKLVVFSDDLESTDPESGYTVAFNNRNVQLFKDGGMLYNSNRANQFMQNEKARIELRFNRKTHQIEFRVDDEVVEVWKDNNPEKGDFGKGVQFIAFNDSPLKINRIEVTSWDGVIDYVPPPDPAMGGRFFGGEMEPEKPKPEPIPEGRMLLRNGDTLEGEVVSIVDGVITLKTKFSELKLPVVRLRSINLKAVEQEEAILRNGDVKAWFPDGTYLVFHLDSVNGDTITGTSQNFGTADFKIAAFSRIEFNLYDVELEELRANGGL
jgi:hypothetical protein